VENPLHSTPEEVGSVPTNPTDFDQVQTKLAAVLMALEGSKDRDLLYAEHGSYCWSLTLDRAIETREKLDRYKHKYHVMRREVRRMNKCIGGWSETARRDNNRVHGLSVRLHESQASVTELRELLKDMQRGKAADARVEELVGRPKESVFSFIARQWGIRKGGGNG
jgi:hypothetical protein